MKTSKELRDEFISGLNLSEQSKLIASLELDQIILTVKSEQLDSDYQRFQENIKSAFSGDK